MEELRHRLTPSLRFVDLAERLRKSTRVLVAPLPSSAQALLAGGLAQRLARLVVFIRPDDNSAQAALGDVTAFYPGLGKLRFDPGSPLLVDSLTQLAAKGGVVIATPADLEAPAPLPLTAAVRFQVQRGERLEPAQLVGWLEENGYQRTDLVTEPGEYAARGGIDDVFPEHQDVPYRIEFADDTVVSIRSFDSLTQRSVQPAEEVVIFTRRVVKAALPAHQLLLANGLVLTESASDNPKYEGVRVVVTEGPDAELDLGFRPAGSYLGNTELLRSEIEAGKSDFFIVGSSEHSCERLATLLGSRPRYLVAGLSAGFVALPARCTVLTEREIYGVPVLRPARRRFKGLPIDNLVALRPGDYVVHADYGVGIFGGTRRLSHGGIEKDFVIVQFAGKDRVYVPVERLGLLDRYMGSEDRPPTIDRIGGSSWLRAKARAARASAEYARELLKIQAQRSLARQEPFPPDDQAQALLEGSFPFAETPDQLRALADVKRDMMGSRPMDRLVCGDVGFGKTEIALRAAFKAAMGLRQVAVLVPTTILCYQHYHNFQARLAPFPLRVAMLSRFVRPAQQKEIVEQLRTGQIDIVIGTQLLLSPKIQFRNLGLLVIDEEQKFGVRQKERIRALKASVAVLTLTATPIPRTLYMALAGLRDISALHTPPPGRREIVTAVAEWDDGLIRTYVDRELNRGGQVFFVHNEIETIHTVGKRLARLLPDVKLGIAHGRLSSRKLADSYRAFAAGEFQLLLSTAIIESGLDMPNVNTIIVNRADRFGLADLHQLRGRVGRAQEQAFALFLIPNRREITIEARKRLSALLAYAQLGSGYRLALRDMEIRGVGNLLGTEQHGHIARVGFNLYTQLLREAVAQLKGEPVPAEPELAIEIPAFLPKEYIPDAFERVALYKRLLAVASEAELTELRAELIDRFGRYPAVVDNLLLIARVRLRARKLGLLRVQLQGDTATVVGPDRTVKLSGGMPGLLEFLSRSDVQAFNRDGAAGPFHSEPDPD